MLIIAVKSQTSMTGSAASCMMGRKLGGLGTVWVAPILQAETKMQFVK